VCAVTGYTIDVGLAKNNPLKALTRRWRIEAQMGFLRTGEPSRVCADLQYRTRKSWSRTQRVALRRLGLRDTELERATPGNNRTRLLKVGAQVRVSVRRVVVALSEAFPAQDIFAWAARNLAPVPPRASPCWPPCRRSRSPAASSIAWSTSAATRR